MRLQSLFIPFLILLLCCNLACACPPEIAGNTDRHVVLSPIETYNFSYSSSEAIVTSHFFINGVESTTGDRFKEYTFTEGCKYYNVSVYGTDSDSENSNLVTWRVTTKREMATTGDIETFSDDDYNNVTEDILSGDWGGIAAPLHSSADFQPA